MKISVPTGSNAEETLAFRRVRRLKSFYFHLMRYAVVVCMLATINLVFSPHYLWFLWVVFGWGVGILFHGMTVVDWFPFLDDKWEKAKVEKYLGRKL